MHTVSRIQSFFLHNKWVRGGANKISCLRLPLLMIVLYGLWSAPELTALDYLLWIIIPQTLGLLADWADGAWARKMTHWRADSDSFIESMMYSDGPSSEGQFLDQFLDKVYMWPQWIILIHYKLDVWQWPWFILLGYLCIADCISCRMHYKNYHDDIKKQQINLSHGAIKEGKWKFAVLCGIMCIQVATFCPDHMYSLWFAGLAETLNPLSSMLMGAPVILATFSLMKRIG